MSRSAIKFIQLLALSFLFTIVTVQAQETTKTIGNRPSKGSSNANFGSIKGNQVGVKMNAGRNGLHLLKLNFGVNNPSTDSIKFKVNVYNFKGEKTEENLVNNPIVGVIPPGKDRINVDLSASNIIAKGAILVSIEFLETLDGTGPVFSLGLFNGGTYKYESGKWKKIPIVGIDFSVQGKQI